MGILLMQQIDKYTSLGIWNITETYNDLFSQIQLHKEEIEKVNSFRNMQRRMEWISVRILTNTILQNSCRIRYNENRKPFLEGNQYQISISHSNKLTSVLISKLHKVGIDLEYMSHQIEKVAHKFINEHEYITSDPELTHKHLYVHWCAKEALYKICDKQDINFKQNLFIEPFSVNLEGGTIIGNVKNKFGHDVFLMKYFFYDNYVIVFCIK